MVQTVSGRNWTLTVNQEWIDVTSERESPDERWTFTDAQGHDHRYERGYPTLDLVVDESHWCDGHEGIYNHDPHEQIDQSHYECLVCREVIEPAMHPPYHQKHIPGMRSATLTGLRSDGAQVEVWLQDDDLERVRQADSDDAVTALIDSLPEDRIYSVTFASR
jgi:hypothetical protein